MRYGEKWGKVGTTTSWRLGAATCVGRGIGIIVDGWGPSSTHGGRTRAISSKYCTLETKLPEDRIHTDIKKHARDDRVSVAFQNSNIWPLKR